MQTILVYTYVCFMYLVTVATDRCKSIASMTTQKPVSEITYDDPAQELVNLDKFFRFTCSATTPLDEEIYVTFTPHNLTQYKAQTLYRNSSHLHAQQVKFNYEGNYPCSRNLSAFVEVRADLEHHEATFSCCRTRPKSCTSKALKVNMSGTSRQCNEKVYDKEYPCKYTDFIDVKDQRTCLTFIDQWATWDQARERCQTLYDADLVKIDGADSNQAIRMMKTQILWPYWIGLNKRKQPNNEQENHRWLDESKKARYVNWEEGSPLHGLTHKDCVLMNKWTGLWRESRCDDRHYYICQKISARNPGQPDLQMLFPFQSAHAFYGYKLFARCSAVTDKKGQIMFTYLAESLKIMTFKGVKDKRISLDRGYVMEGKRCVLKFNASLTIQVTKNMTDGSIFCCWFTPNGLTKCSDPAPFEPHYLRQAPVLTVEDITGGVISLLGKTFMFANCSAFVGTDGQLVWSLHLPMTDQTLEWRIGTNGSVLNKGVHEVIANHSDNATDVKEISNRTLLHWILTQDPDSGPHITSELRRIVSDDLDGATLACSSYCPHTDVLNTPDMTVTSPVFDVSGVHWKAALTIEDLMLFGLIFLLTASFCTCVALPLAPSKQSIKMMASKVNFLRKRKKKPRRKRPATTRAWKLKSLLASKFSPIVRWWDSVGYSHVRGYRQGDQEDGRYSSDKNMMNGGEEDGGRGGSYEMGSWEWERRSRGNGRRVSEAARSYGSRGSADSEDYR